MTSELFVLDRRSMILGSAAVLAGNAVPMNLVDEAKAVIPAAATPPAEQVMVLLTRLAVGYVQRVVQFSVVNNVLSWDRGLYLEEAPAWAPQDMKPGWSTAKALKP